MLEGKVSRLSRGNFCVSWQDVIKRICKVNGKVFTAILDSGSSINVVSGRAARRIGNRIVPADKQVRTVGLNLGINEMVTFDITIGKINSTVTAYIVELSPEDILLGVPFLIRHSKGFAMMCEEFLAGSEAERELSLATTIINTLSIVNLHSLHFVLETMKAGVFDLACT